MATLMFEFGTLPKSTLPTLDDFLVPLDPFLASLTGGLRYGVEIRKPEHFPPEYLSLLQATVWLML